MVECFIQDREVGVRASPEALCSWAIHFILCLVLVELGMIRLDISKKNLTGI